MANIFKGKITKKQSRFVLVLFILFSNVEHAFEKQMSHVISYIHIRSDRLDLCIINSVCWVWCIFFLFCAENIQNLNRSWRDTGTQFITMIAIKKKIWGTSDMNFRAYTYVEYHIERQFQNFTREFWEKCKSSKLYYIKYINLLIWTTSSTFLNSSFCVCISNFMEKTLA